MPLLVAAMAILARIEQLDRRLRSVAQREIPCGEPVFLVDDGIASELAREDDLVLRARLARVGPT